MNIYRIRYVYFNPNSKQLGGVKATRDFKCETPITALNQFHRFMQKETESDSQRTILRVQCGPSEYKLESLHQVYHDCGFQADVTRTKIVESAIDLPSSPNPDLSDSKSSTEKQPELALD